MIGSTFIYTTIKVIKTYPDFILELINFCFKTGKEVKLMPDFKKKNFKP